MSEPRLFVLSGRDVGRSFSVGEGALLGRAEECEVRLGDRSVSRQHARIERMDGGWWVADLDSRNGIWIEGRRVSRARLSDLAEFRLGEVQLRCRLEASARPEPELDELGELVLEEDELQLPEEAEASDESRAESQAGGLDRELRELVREARGDPGGGLWTGDLGQRPGWQVLLLGLLALALAGAAAWAGFLLVVRVRGG